MRRFAVLILAAFCCAGCTKPNPVALPSKNVTVDKASVELFPGDQVVVTATAENTTISPAISNDGSVATASTTSSSGRTATILVTGVDPGTTTVVVPTTTTNLVATISVLVKPRFSVALAPNPIDIANGTTMQLVATIHDNKTNVNINSSNVALRWETVDASVATVDNNGNLRGLKEGTTDVKVTMVDQKGPNSVTVRVTVRAPRAHSIAVAPPSASIAVGGTQLLTAVVRNELNEVVANPAVTWTSANTAVATVSQTGLVTGVAPGTVDVTANVTGSPTIAAKSTITVTQTSSCNLGSTGLFANFFTVTVASDPGGNAGRIGLPTGHQALRVNAQVTNTTIAFADVAPFVGGSGFFVDGCRYVATGRGTIGGIANVGVKLEGTWVTSNPRVVTYTVGTGGELPGGQPTVFTLTF